MIKLFLNHLIIDKCINLLFSRIQSNFIEFKNDIRKGDSFKIIRTTYNDCSYYNCTILETNDFKSRKLAVFSYTTCKLYGKIKVQDSNMAEYIDLLECIK